MIETSYPLLLQPPEDPKLKDYYSALIQWANDQQEIANRNAQSLQSEVDAIKAHLGI